MKVVIIEDERPASDKLMRLLAETAPEAEVAAVLRSVEQSLDWLDAHPSPDLIFMDIQLEDGLSFELFENREIHTPVIFTTAYDDYMLKAFKVNSIDYLLKPIAVEELEGALRKFHTLHHRRSDYHALANITREMSPVLKERFLVKIGERYRSVPVADIYAFYIRERSTFLFTKAGKHYPIDYSLERIEARIDPGHFFRISRSFIVRFDAIGDVLSYSSSRLKILLAGWNDPEEIIISRDRIATFKEWLDR